MTDDPRIPLGPSDTVLELRQVGAAVLRGISTGVYAAAWTLVLLSLVLPLVDALSQGDPVPYPWPLLVVAVPLFSAGWWLRTDADKVARGDRLEA